MSFYSEYQEDVWINANLALPKDGFYLDVGCAHPTAGSNTGFLRDRGWRGLAIDGHAGWAPYWRAHPFTFMPCIVSSKPVVRYHHDNQLSRISDDGVLKSARRLDDILGERMVKQIDFLSVDAEGSEYEILQTFDLFQYTPKIIVAEYRTQMPDGIQEDYRVRDWLLGSGKYMLVHTTYANLIFCAP